MTAENYPRIMAHVFEFEGGWSDHPEDKGGATQFGVTIGVLGEWRGRPVTKAEVKALKKEEAAEIFRKRYWTPVAGDELPSGIDLCVMDSGVNSGVSRGAKWLQRALTIKVDGKVGIATLAAAEAADPVVVINRMCDDRMNFLKSLPTWGTFGKGWFRRVDAVRALALSLAAQDEAYHPVPVPVEPSQPGDLTLSDYIRAVELALAGIRKLTGVAA